jgi:hypothetical protein
VSQSGKRIRDGMADLTRLQQTISDRAAKLMYGPSVARPDRPPAEDPESVRRQLLQDLALAVVAIQQVLEAIVEIAGPEDLPEA